MRRSTLSKLCCPACRSPYSVREIGGSRETIETATLSCPDCCITIPLLNGFPVFQDQHLTDLDLEARRIALFGSELEYRTFLEQKKVKPVFDLYAAFQPFNESTQSIFPLIPLLREKAEPGDFILDLWCRTGWSGELLAALFPRQIVISVWESPSGLLGTKGFQYWLGSGKRRENLDIIFHSPNDPLPFADRTFSIIHGLDTLHRYKHVPLISECLRVVTDDGIVLFPHNHLTNSQPDPYFDRGEDQIHGVEYREYFSRLLRKSNRKALILSEKTLFDAEAEYTVADEAETDHYNACILIADERVEGRKLRKIEKQYEDYADAFVIVNPLWRIDWALGIATPAPETMDTGGSELFYRHPMYLERLRLHSPVHLRLQDLLILYWANKNQSVRSIAARADVEPQTCFRMLMKLEERELVQIQNVSPAMARLQQFYGTQLVPPQTGEQTLKCLWDKAAFLYRDQPFIAWPQDGSVFSYGDSEIIVSKAAALLTSLGVEPGDRIAIEAVAHPEFIFAFWAAVLLGAVVVPLNPDLKKEELDAVLDRVRPRLALMSSTEKVMQRRAQVIPIGIAEDARDFGESFSVQLADLEPCAEFPQIQESQTAVILFTSGSTGTPKGILLSHGALYRTSEIIDRNYRWRRDDRFLGGGNFHTMSGLRNPCIAVLHSGACVVVPQAADLQNPFSLMSLCLKNEVTILNVTPGFLAYWGRAAQKSKYFQDNRIRMVLSTASSLQSIHREIFQQQFQIPVYDYYGLTETCGACILETDELCDIPEKGIGRPVDCLTRICEDGELAIYSENLMIGYLDDPQATGRRIQNGWLLTGDIARINEHGCIVLVGRKDRMMKDKNGELIYPELIEKAIHSIPGVADVHVAGYQDELLVDHIAAFIQFDGFNDGFEPELEEVRRQLLNKLAAAHVPTLLLAVSQMPRGATGKVSKDAEQTLIAEELKRRR